MSENFKTSQTQGTISLSTYSTLYNTSSSVQAIISTLAICNTASTTAVTYRIGVDETAGTPNNSEWIVYDSTVPANDTVFLTVGMSLQENRFIRISSSASTSVFSAFISEIS